MSPAFSSRWMRWDKPDTSHQRTDKTDETFSSLPETGSHRTDKTDRSPFVSSVSSLPAHSLKSRGETHEGAQPLQDDRAAGIAAMTLDDFATAGLVVTVFSAKLGRRVLFVSDNVPKEHIGSPQLPMFRAAELKRLATLDPPPRSLRTVAEVKAVFRDVGATIVECKHE